jgi:hypothetical protein
MFFLLFLVLSATKQIHHDAIEQQIWSHLQQQKDSIMDRWPHAGRRLLSDFHRASNATSNFIFKKFQPARKHYPQSTAIWLSKRTERLPRLRIPPPMTLL